MKHRILALAGLELTPTNHVEKLVSGLGGLVAIAAVMLITHALVGPEAVMPVVASMGASAVLLFAVPHGALSQPWPVAAGHMISAIVGVAAARWIASPPLAAAVAVGVAISAMYYTRSIHPPGGATALTAVLGGTALRTLGFSYVLMPVGVNVAVMLVVAVAFNYPFAWRRFPAALLGPRETHGKLTREDWAFAIEHMQSMVDVTEDELIELHDAARLHAARRVKGTPRSATTPPRTMTPVR